MKLARFNKTAASFLFAAPIIFGSGMIPMTRDFTTPVMAEQNLKITGAKPLEESLAKLEERNGCINILSKTLSEKEPIYFLKIPSGYGQAWTKSSSNAAALEKNFYAKGERGWYYKETETFLKEHIEPYLRKDESLTESVNSYIDIYNTVTDNTYGYNLADRVFKFLDRYVSKEHSRKEVVSQFLEVAAKVPQYKGQDKQDKYVSAINVFSETCPWPLTGLPQGLLIHRY